MNLVCFLKNLLCMHSCNIQHVHAGLTRSPEKDLSCKILGARNTFRGKDEIFFDELTLARPKVNFS